MATDYRAQRANALYKANLDAAGKAQTIRHGIQAKVDAILSKAQADADKAAKPYIDQANAQVKAAETEYADAIKRAFKETVYQYSGGFDNTKSLIVRHWKAVAPDEPKADDGVLMAFTARGILTIFDLAATDAAAHAEYLATYDDAERARYEKTVKEALLEVRKRYAILPRLIDNRFAARLFADAKLTEPQTRTEAVDGGYGYLDMTIKTAHVPELLSVSVTPDGLELTYAHRGGDTAEAWSRQTAILRSSFKSHGVDADKLAISEDAHGNIVLRFNDAPNSFPKAVAPRAPRHVPQNRAEALQRYPSSMWRLGVDARGNVIEFPMTRHPHCLVCGGTGGGKSVWIRSQLEYLRTGGAASDGADTDTAGGWSIYVSDGKGSDFAALDGLPNVAYVAPNSDPSQLVLMLKTLEREMDRRTDAAKMAKKAGNADAFNFQPIIVVLDEWGSTAITLEDRYGAKGFEAIARIIDRLLRVGRETRIHVALSSQTIRKTGAGSVPGSWQANLSIIVSLGEPEPATVEYAFPAAARDRATMIGSRVKGKPGRGLYVDVDTNSAAEFQSFYGWSPGTTSLDPKAPSNISAPTPEVRAEWQRWQPMSASVPILVPRLGIKASGSDWRGEGNKDKGLESIFATPMVALTDEDGNVKPGFEKYDPTSDSWLGEFDRSTGGVTVALDGFTDDADMDADAVTFTPAEPEPKAEPKAAPTTEADVLAAVQEMASRGATVTKPAEADAEAEMRRIAIANGWLTPDHPDHPDHPSNSTHEARLEKLVKEPIADDMPEIADTDTGDDI